MDLKEFEASIQGILASIEKKNLKKRIVTLPKIQPPETADARLNTYYPKVFPECVQVAKDSKKNFRNTDFLQFNRVLILAYLFLLKNKDGELPRLRGKVLFGTGLYLISRLFGFSAVSHQKKNRNLFTKGFGNWWYHFEENPLGISAEGIDHVINASSTRILLNYAALAEFMGLKVVPVNRSVFQVIFTPEGEYLKRALRVELKGL